MLRKISFILLLTIVSTHVFSQGLRDLSFGTDSTLEIVSWNIEWFPKNGVSTIDSVKEIIVALDADIIGLQEISDTASFRQMINGIPGFELLLTGGYTGGLAYVYKTSSISVQSFYKIYNTSANRNFFPRPPVVLKFTYQGEPYIAINNHFKCCGNGILDFGNTSDEEYRRLAASDLLKQHIEYNFYNEKVIVLGDLNDILTDPPQNNVFQVFLSDSANYKFADMPIAAGPVANWSFPGWPSHLDHILITSELFNAFDNSGSSISSIRVDDYMPGGFSSYDFYVSDHRPVGMKLNTDLGSIGLNEDDLFEAKMYPNPTQGSVTVEFSHQNEPAEISIFDMYGKQIIRKQNIWQKIAFHLEGPSGIYMIQVSTGNQVYTRRISKL